MKTNDAQHGGLPDIVVASSIDQVMSMNRTMDGQGRVVVFLNGRIDEKRLESAAAKAMMAEPMLGYRFVDDRTRPYWQKVEASDRSASFHIFDCSNDGRQFIDFMIDPVRPEQAPQVKIGVFRQKDDVICIRSNHMALDGGGAIRYLGLLSSIYTELGRDQNFSPPLGTAARPSPRRLLHGDGIIGAVRALPGMVTPGEEWGIGMSSGSMSEQRFHIRQFGPDRTKAMRTYARNEGVTINDLLLAAYFRALVEVIDPAPDRNLRMEVPLNLRRHLPDAKVGSISNLSAVYFLNLKRMDEDLRGTVQRVHRLMERHKANRTELAEMLLLELMLLPGKDFLMKMQEWADFQIAHPVLSNLGVIDPSVVDFGEPEVRDVQFIGPTLYPPNVGLGVSTFRDTMTLNMNSTSEETAMAFVRVLEHMDQELPR